jgi:predicted nucleic acid-binding protein
MARIIVLDTGPLGLATQSPSKPEAARCGRWLRDLERSGAVIAVPEIADYELRRELIRAGVTAGIDRLDAFETTADYLPITSDVMKYAAWLWAAARNAGRPTAPKEALDGDAILAAHALLSGDIGDSVTIATTNLGHLSIFPGVDAAVWDTIA